MTDIHCMNMIKSKHHLPSKEGNDPFIVNRHRGLIVGFNDIK